MGKSSPKPPPPPDPTAIINAQTASNIATANNQQTLNMVGTSGPDGSVGWVKDPNQPGGYTQTTTLSPGAQTTYDLNQTANQGALKVAGDQITRVGDALGSKIDYSSVPGLTGSVSNPGAVRSFDQGPGVRTGYSAGGTIQTDIGPTDFTRDREAVTDAVYGQARSRLDPYWQQQENAHRARLANQGLSYNSAAFDNAEGQFGRNRNDAYDQATYSAIKAGSDQQQRFFDQSLQQGMFHNAAQDQQYGQNAALAEFYNRATGDQFGRNLTAASFDNAGRAQDFNQSIAAGSFGNTARQQAISEQVNDQNRPIDQFNALMSGTQVSRPEGIGYTPTAVQPVDVLGAHALNTQAANANYQTAVQKQQSGLGGLFALGSAAIKAAPFFSDERLKRDIEPLGRVGDHEWYSYRYVWSDEPRVGVLAHEVARVTPDAVKAHPTGFLMVDYRAL